MILMPVSNIAVAGLRSSSGGGVRWMGDRGISSGSGGPLSRTLPATSRRRPRTGSRDAAHGSLVEVCLNLDDEGPGPIPFDDERFFKPRKLTGLEGDVDHRPADGEDLSSRLRGLRHRDDRSCFRTGFLQNMAIQAWCERFDL
jgi:hypothetical protein